MQKKLIALAVVGAFAAPAFAATSNADFYGAINMSIDSVDNGADRNTHMRTNNNSFWGFKGSEDLGGGLKAVFQLEANINFDGSQSNAADAGNIFGTRNTYLGLAGGFGTVVFGVHDTPYKMATGKLDNFVGTIGDYNAIFGSGGSTSTNNSSFFDLRTGNTIAYLSPKFGGFDVKAAYVLGETTGSSSAADAWSVSGTYAQGPLFLTAAYETHNEVATTSCNPGATCLGAGGTADRDAWKIGAGFDIGALSLGAAYESVDGDTGASTTREHDAWMINASYKMGNIKLKGQYIAAGDVNSVNNTGADMWAIGADYSMSKRTTVQLTYAKVSNDSAGNWNMGQGAGYNRAAQGDDVSGYSIGMRHTF